METPLPALAIRLAKTTDTVSVPAHPKASVTETVYVVLAPGVAIGLEIAGLLKLPAGLQV
jgi:hypothetical protein